ncbi:MAG: hypothetical protein U0Q19_16105 [Kineosporiaceae bacterium]
MLSDEQIAALSPDQRRELIRRLRRPLHEVDRAPEGLHRLRRIRLVVTIVGSAALVPWTLYLATSLPAQTVVENWQAVWVGYDVLLFVMLALTAWLGWRHRLAAVLTSLATGVLILADAWFDVLTASRFDIWRSVVAALLIEVPVAILLMAPSVRLLRLSMLSYLVVPVDTSFWRLPLPLLHDDPVDERVTPNP